MTLVATQGPTQGQLSQHDLYRCMHSKPSWFVIASNDRVISQQQECGSAKKMNAKTLTLPTSHVHRFRSLRKSPTSLKKLGAVHYNCPDLANQIVG
jgi:hypothetical protein